MNQVLQSFEMNVLKLIFYEKYSLFNIVFSQIRQYLVGHFAKTEEESLSIFVEKGAMSNSA